MKAKELMALLQRVDPEAIIVNFYTNADICLPVDDVLVGSLYIHPGWAAGGHMIVDNGQLAANEAEKNFLKLKNVAILPAICIK